MSTYAERKPDISDDSASHDDEGWADEVEFKSQNDARKQPWKSTCGDVVNSQRCGEGQDLVTLSAVKGGKADYLFRAQAGSLAA